MTLIKGTSHAAMSHNYKVERASGKSPAQARAIMLHKAGIKRKRKSAKRKKRRRI